MKSQQLFKFTFIIGLWAVLLYGCVYSVHPLFTEEELVWRPELLGIWQGDDETTWEFRRGDGRFFDVIQIQDTDTTYLEAGLGKVGDFYFLDFVIGDIEKLHEMELYHLFPTHTFAKVSFGKQQVTLEWFATRWLENLIKDKRIRIKHELENDQVLLTASTEELQKFIHKYAGEPKAFEDPKILTPNAVQ